MLRYLFGPVPGRLADAELGPLQDAGECRTFGLTDAADLRLLPGDSWDVVLARLRPWQPDFIILDLGYTSVPEWLWTSPVPIVGLAHDWTWLWHGIRRQAARCDLVLSDAGGVEALTNAGFRHIRQAVFFGASRAVLDYPWPAVDADRDVDVLFVGNLHPAVQRERLRWLGRLSHLADQYNVVIRTGVFGEDYRTLLGRSKIGRVEESLPFLAESLERSAPTDSIVRKLYALLAQGCRKLGRPAEAVEWCGKGRAHYPQDVELLLVEGLARRETGDLEGSAVCLRMLLQNRETGHFASVDAGLRGYKARHNLAVVCRELGRLDEAEEHWLAAVKEEPGFTPAWDGLDELNRQQGRKLELKH